MECNFKSMLCSDIVCFFSDLKVIFCIVLEVVIIFNTYFYMAVAYPIFDFISLSHFQLKTPV